MPNNIDPDDLWQLMWDKFKALSAAEQALLETPLIDRPDIEMQLRRIISEKNQVSKAMDFLDFGSPIDFPSDEQIEALQREVGRLGQLAQLNNDVNALMGAVTNVLKTWPVSAAG